MNPIIAQYADIIESVNDARSLLRVEDEVKGDEFIDAADKAAILRLIAGREGLLLGSDADAARALRADRLKAMWAALKSVGVKGSGVSVTQRISNGKRVPLKGGGFDVPAGGSGRGDDSTQGALNEFLDRFIRPHLSEGYLQPGRGDGSKAKLLGGKELLDTEGIVPPDAAQAGLNQFILEGGEDGAFDADTISAIAARFALSKSATERARGAARKRAQGERAEAPTPRAPRKKAAAIKAAAPKATPPPTPTAPPESGPADRIRAQITAAVADPRERAQAYAAAGVGRPGDDAPPPGAPLAKVENARLAAQADKKAREERAELDAVMKASHASGGITEDQYEKYLSEKPFDPNLTSGERRAATSRLGSLGGKRQTKEKRDAARQAAALAREDKKHAADHARSEAAHRKEQDKDPATRFEEARAEALRAVSNRFASDPALRAKYNTRSHREAEQEELKRRGLQTEADTAGAGRGRAGGRLGMLLGLEGAVAVAGVARSARAGADAGKAAGAVASGLERGVLSAAGGFIHAGQTAMGLFLSPFGQAGAGLASLAGGLGDTLLGVLGAAGGVAVAGVKIGAMIVGGIAGGIGAGAGAVLGAVLGTLAGVGPLAGAVAGAGLFASLASAASSLLSGIGGAIGSALGAIGSAFGTLGKGVGDFLGSVKSVLQDLIETGTKASQASLSTQRNSGMTAGASSEATALSQVLTGGPGAFSGMFQNFGMMGLYQPKRNGAFGVGGTGENFTENLPALFKKWSSYGDTGMGAMQRRIMLSIVAPGAQETVGNLFSLGGGAVNKAVQTARAVKLTPAENLQNATLAMNLNEIQAQLDRLKSKFLTDLMPALNMGLDLFGKFFAANEAKIVSGLASFGRWMATDFPGLLRTGIDAVFEFAASLAESIPAIADFGKSVFQTFAAIFNGVKGFMSSTLDILTSALGAVGDLFPPAMKAANGMAGSAIALHNAKDLDPNAMDGLFDRMAAASPGLTKSIRDGKGTTDRFLDGAGVHNMSQQGFDQYVKNSQKEPQKVEVHITADLVTHPDKDSHTRLEMRVQDQVLRGLVRGQQRASN